MKWIPASLGLVVLILLSGCSFIDDYGPKQQGSLILTLTPQMENSKTIEPSLDMTVDSYDVVGAGPEGATFEQLGLPSSTAAVVENSLAAGAWTVRTRQSTNFTTSF